MEHGVRLLLVDRSGEAVPEHNGSPFSRTFTPWQPGARVLRQRKAAAAMGVQRFAIYASENHPTGTIDRVTLEPHEVSASVDPTLRWV